MIIRKLSQVLNTENNIEAPNGNWMSSRLITKVDNMGFSVSDTIIKAGTETRIWYKNHLEAVYCLSGNGSIEDSTSGITHHIEPGVLYALDHNEKHILRGGSEDMHLVCVFCPALRGDEVHDKDGSYPIDSSA